MNKQNDCSHCHFSKSIRAVAWILVLVQWFVWIYITHNLLFSGKPLVIWDLARYWGDAANLYVADNFFEQLRTTIFPVFSWHIVWVFRFFEIPMSYSALAFVNLLFWQALFIGATYWLCRLLKVNSIIGAVVVSFHLASAEAFSATSGLMGDLPVLSWCVLVLCLLCAASRRTKLALLFAFVAGFVLGCGTQIKTICIMAGLCAIGGFGLSMLHSLIRAEKSTRLKYIGGACLKLAVVVAGLAASIWLLAPRNTFDIIDIYYYNNETLAIWKTYEGLFNGILWAPNVILEAFPFIGMVLSVLLVLLLAISIKINRKSISEVIKNEETADLLLVGAPIIVAVSYVSFFVVSKFIRPVYFLLPTFLFVVILFIRLAVSKVGEIRYPWVRRIFPIVILGICIINTVCTASWVLFQGGSWVNHVFLMPKGKFKLAVPATKEPTWEDTGLQKIHDYLNEIATEGKGHWFYVLVPSYMGTLNGSLLQTSYLTLSVVEGKTLPKPPPITYIDFTFKYGAWGNFGGFPRAYFLNTYTLYSNQGWVETLPDDLLLYPNLLCKRLSEGSPLYWEGMEPVIKDKNAAGFDVVLAKRVSIARPETFLEIMRDVATLDPNNQWNLPFLAAAYQMDPDPLFKEQIEYMLSDSFKPVYVIDYALVTRQIKHLREHWPEVPPALRYPEVLGEHADLPAE